MTGWNIVLLIALIVVAWLGFWVSLISLIARFGGWRTLAEAYPAPPLPPHETLAQQTSSPATFTFQSVTLRRWVGYNHGITFKIQPEGLRLSVVSIIRPGHRPILLPWSQFTTTPTKALGMSFVRLDTQSVPQIPLTITAKLAEKLAKAAGDRWPG